MSIPIFPNGIRGLSDSKWSGAQGEAHKLVGVDFRSEPRVVKAHQKLDKISSVIENDKEVDVVDELCNSVVTLDDGNRVWFSSESGKIWKQDPSDNFSLLHTLNVANDYKEPNSNVGTMFDDFEEGEVTVAASIGHSYYGDVGQIIDNITLSNSGIDHPIKGASDISISDFLLEAYEKMFFLAYSTRTIDGGDENASYVSVQSTYNDGIKNWYLPMSHLKTESSAYNLSDVITIDSTHFLVGLSRFSDTSKIKIFETNSSGSTLTEKSSETYSSSGSTGTQIKKIRDDLIILLYNTGSNSKIKLYEIDASYNITEKDEYNMAGMNLSEPINIRVIDNDNFLVSGLHHIATYKINNNTKIEAVSEISLTDEFSSFVTGVVAHPISSDNKKFIISYKQSSQYYLQTLDLDDDNEIELGERKRVDFYCYEFLSIGEDKVLARATNNKDNVDNDIYTTITLNEKGEIAVLGSTYEGTDMMNPRNGHNRSVFPQGDEINTTRINKGVPQIINRKIKTSYTNSALIEPEKERVEIISATGITGETSVDKKIKKKIEIPNEDNVGVVVFCGNIETTTLAVSSIKIDGTEMTEIYNNTTAENFRATTSAYYATEVTNGEKEIVVEYNGSSQPFGFVSIVVLKDVKKSNPIKSHSGSWDNKIKLPGDKSGQMRLMSTFNTQGEVRVGDHQKEILNLTATESKTNKDVLFSSVSVRDYNTGTNKIVNAKMFSYQEIEVPAKEENDYKYGNGEIVNDIFFCNDDVLFRIKDKDIDDWAEKMETVDNFKHGSDQHSMVVQNSELFISDKHSIAKVSKSMEFLPEVFGGLEPEEITSLTSFDTDILIGTKNGNQARVLRWDCFDRGYYAQDEIFEKGVNTFIKDDNYTYVSVGETGKLYYYNGEKLDLFKRIDGGWDKNNTAIIHDNSVTTFNGIPLFGLSTKNGTPTEMGLYGLGSYSNRYPKSLSLDFPVPTSELDNVKIGAMTVRDCDLYVSYKTETDVGIAKLNHNKKYPNAYIETTMLTDLRERGVGSIIEGVTAEYVELPEDTDVKIGSKTKYDDDYVDMDTVIDTGKMLVGTKNNIPNISNLQLRFELLSKDNDSPVIENFSLC